MQPQPGFPAEHYNTTANFDELAAPVRKRASRAVPQGALPGHIFYPGNALR
ncbi:MAG: hypothetical protein R3C12_11635 [Planctomycetaceae bacterium]